MKNKLLYLLLFGLTLLGTGFYCSNSISGVETTNGFTVVATSQSIEGTASAYAQIFLFDTSYVPFIDSGVGFVTAADENGHFRFSAYPGTYNILAIDITDNSVGIISDAVITPDTIQSEVIHKDHFVKTGSISGNLTSADNGRILVYLAGLCYYEVLTGSSQFTFTSVPPGTYELCFAVINSTQPTSFELKNKTVITIESGKATPAGEISIP